MDYVSGIFRKVLVMIVFIGCRKSKLNCKAKAKDMYTGNYFKKTLQFARTFNADKIFVLSAKYGLLELDDVISPYDLTLNKMSKQDKKVRLLKFIYN